MARNSSNLWRFVVAINRLRIQDSQLGETETLPHILPYHNIVVEMNSSVFWLVIDPSLTILLYTGIESFDQKRAKRNLTHEITHHIPDLSHTETQRDRAH